MTRCLNVTPKTTEQHIIVRSGKCEAVVTIIKDCARGILLLKLTTEKHQASRDLSLLPLYTPSTYILQLTMEINQV